jgi:hypothetical protein
MTSKTNKSPETTNKREKSDQTKEGISENKRNERKREMQVLMR